MVKKIFFLIFVVFTLSFGEVNDSGKFLTADEKIEVEGKISEFEKENNIKYYVNLGRKMDEKDIIEKAIILNIIPDGKNQIDVQLKFTQDIDTSSYDEALNDLMVNNEELIKKKDYKTLILNTLDLSDKIVIELEKSEVTLEKTEVKKSFLENKFGLFIIIILIGLAILVTIRFFKIKGIKKR